MALFFGKIKCVFRVSVGGGGGGIVGMLGRHYITPSEMRWYEHVLGLVHTRAPLYLPLIGKWGDEMCEDERVNDGHTWSEGTMARTTEWEMASDFEMSVWYGMGCLHR